MQPSGGRRKVGTMGSELVKVLKREWPADWSEAYSDAGDSAEFFVGCVQVVAGECEGCRWFRIVEMDCGDDEEEHPVSFLFPEGTEWRVIREGFAFQANNRAEELDAKSKILKGLADSAKGE